MSTTPDRRETCPLPREQVVDRYFLEHRAKLLDIAAFLDRLDRAAPADGEAQPDERVRMLQQAIEVLGDDQPERTRRMLELFSDPTAEPIAAAPGKGAVGVYVPSEPRG